jgi:hypothetical protein
VLEAKQVKEVPSFEQEQTANKSINLDKQGYALCKELFTPANINLALSELGLEYKMIDEVDIYNIIEHILVTNREN